KIVTREYQSALLLRFGRILVPNNLEVGRLEEITPSFPIIFGKRILKRDNRILARKALVHIGKLLVRYPFARIAVGVLVVKIVLLRLCLVEFAGRDIHGDFHFPSVSSLFNSVGDDVQSFLSCLDVRSDTTLITNISS